MGATGATCGACGTGTGIGTGGRPLPFEGKRGVAAGKGVAPTPRAAGNTGLTGGETDGTAVGGRGVGVEVIELRNGIGAAAGAGAGGVKAIGAAGLTGVTGRMAGAGGNFVSRVKIGASSAGGIGVGVRVALGGALGRTVERGSASVTPDKPFPNGPFTSSGIWTCRWLWRRAINSGLI